jgi:hypothetical protein
MDENIDFVAEPVRYDNEQMVQITVIDTSEDIGRVIDTATLTQNLEFYTNTDSISSDGNTQTRNSDLFQALEQGDIVRDMNPPDWASEPKLLEVERVTSQRAWEYNVDSEHKTTVAEKNPNYSQDSHVIECSFIESGNDKVYAYPLERLEPYNIKR